MVQAEYYDDLAIHTLDREGYAYGITTHTVDGACRIFQCSHNFYRS